MAHRREKPCRYPAQEIKKKEKKKEKKRARHTCTVQAVKRSSPAPVTDWVLLPEAPGPASLGLGFMAMHLAFLSILPLRPLLNNVTVIPNHLSINITDAYLPNIFQYLIGRGFLTSTLHRRRTKRFGRL